MSDAAPPPTPSTAALMIAAAGAGLVVVMLLAFLTPRWTADEGTNWLLTFLGGLVAAAVTYAVGAVRKGRRTTTVQPPR